MKLWRSNYSRSQQLYLGVPSPCEEVRRTRTPPSPGNIGSVATRNIMKIFNFHSHPLPPAKTSGERVSTNLLPAKDTMKGKKQTIHHSARQRFTTTGMCGENTENPNTLWLMILYLSKQNSAACRGAENDLWSQFNTEIERKLAVLGRRAGMLSSHSWEWKQSRWTKNSPDFTNSQARAFHEKGARARAWNILQEYILPDPTQTQGVGAHR